MRVDSKRVWVRKWVHACALGWPGCLALALMPAQAQTLPDLSACAGMEAAEARLACYDEVAGRAAMMALPAPASATPPSPGRAAATAAPPSGSNSLMSRYWELSDEDKRGTFNYTAYRPNFFMPLRTSSHNNRRPYTPTQGYAENLPNYKRLEAKLQLSLRTKVIQDALVPGGDLWVGYTQESNWQLYNHGASAPFRNTDYQPEAVFVAPTPAAWQRLPAGWHWRMSQLGFVHQSNGQTDPLSRSWNRFYLGLGLEREEMSLLWRAEQVLDRKSEQDNNNPDIVDYLGRQQLALSWSPGRSTVALQWRPSLRGRGSLRADWSYPVFDRPADGLRWYAQLFHGYGDSLLDYNLRQSTVGVGLSLHKF
jgi:phospholipase A1